MAASRPPASSRSATALRSAETSSDSSSVRPGASPTQNGIVGCRPVASRTRMTPLRHLHDLPRMGAEQEDVALHGLDREVLVHGADEHVARLHQHAVVAGLGNRSARGEAWPAGRPGGRGAAR